jgi:hypothetical protein
MKSMLSKQPHLSRLNLTLATGLLVSFLAASAQAIPLSLNVRDQLLTAGSTSDEASLEHILTTMTDYSGGFGQADQSINALFSPVNDAPVAGLVVEHAGYRDSNELGVYNLNGDTITLFKGSANLGDVITLQFSGDQLSVNGDVVADFGTTFGFFLYNEREGFTWYSQDILNPGERAHFLAFEDEDTVYFGFEDLDLGDRDYNDMVAKVTGIRGAITPTPIPEVVASTPEPTAALAFAVGAALVATSARRRARA